MTDSARLPDERPVQKVQASGLGTIRLLAQQAFHAALNFVFPPRCIGCARVGSLFCSRCQAALTIPAPICAPDSPLVERRATATFEGSIREAIHALKYKGRYAFADPLAERLATALAESGWRPDLVTAAPLHEKRLRQRGYNQAALLAERLAQRTRLPYHADAVLKVRDTQPQVGLGWSARQENVAGAFAARPEIVSGKAVLLIDDVYTTGATLLACAHALREAGAVRVWGLTVASATRQNSL